MVLRVGLVGVGAMGSNHARIIHENSRADLSMVFDLNERAAEKAAKQWGTKAARTIDELSECDAIVIASSTAAEDDEDHSSTINPHIVII